MVCNSVLTVIKIRNCLQDTAVCIERLWPTPRPDGSLCEHKIIFVSVKFPEDIPWFRASRSAVVAAIPEWRLVVLLRHTLTPRGILRTPSILSAFFEAGYFPEVVRCKIEYTEYFLGRVRQALEIEIHPAIL